MVGLWILLLAFTRLQIDSKLLFLSVCFYFFVGRNLNLPNPSLYLSEEVFSLSGFNEGFAALGAYLDSNKNYSSREYCGNIGRLMNQQNNELAISEIFIS